MKRLTPATLTVAMFGIIGVLVLAYFAKNLFAQKEKPAGPVLSNVPMAVADIKPGTVITENHLGMGRHDKSKLTADVLLVNRVIVGRVAREPIKAATPIKAGQLYPSGELPPLEIAPGMRAVSVEVGDGVAMVDGLIRPGNRVDVLFTAQGAGSGGTDATLGGGLTMRLFEAVKVLAINRNFSQGKVDRGNNHVTLELTVAQTNVVVLAKDRGKITLTFNPNGQGNGGLALSNSERVTLYELLGLEKSDPQKDPFMTEIFRGTTRTSNHYDASGRFVARHRIQSNQNQQPTYQLPNSNVPGRGQAPANGNQQDADPSYDPPPQPNGLPNHSANQMLQQPNFQQVPRNAPTAQLLQPRN